MIESLSSLPVNAPAEPGVTFAELPDELKAACGRANWPDLMPVQSQTLRPLLAGRDLLVQSRTGSGKTGAFLLPALLQALRAPGPARALILVPTRELAVQVSREATMLAGPGGPENVAVYGGVSYGPQVDAFQRGAPIVIGTPGRILDHVLRKNLSLDGVKFLVLDEADRMLSMGFYPDMKRIRRMLPAKGVQTALFSATYPTEVMRLSAEFLHEPATVSLSRDRVHVAEVDHRIYVAPGMDKDRALVRILELENPPSALIFCNRREEVHYYAVVLQRFGYDADELSSDLSQRAREEVMGRLRRGELRFLVATDVAGRGIDIPDLSHVVQIGVSDDPEGYIHRAGRTGRAGAAGVAISLVDVLERNKLEQIAVQFKITFNERTAPTEEDLAAVVGQRLTALLESRLRSLSRIEKERLQRFAPLARTLCESEDETDLIAMLLDSLYHESLHGTPDGPPEAGASAPPRTEPREGDPPPREGARRRRRR